MKEQTATDKRTGREGKKEREERERERERERCKDS